jgi:trimeric autotransporter adhesin
VDRTLSRRIGAGLSAVLASATLTGIAGLTGPAASAADPELATGPDWTVERAAGGYLVTVELDEPLPIKSDAPTVVVDGVAVGLATEAADGLSLSVFTTDPSVVSAEDVEPGWSADADPASRTGTADAPVEVPEAGRAPALEADPTELGDFDWTESIYYFGDQSVPLAAIGGVRGELEGKVYLPTTGGERPTVLLLHGRHTSCYGTGPSNPLRWPCSVAPGNTDRKSIPSYAGYDGTARALASNGYAVVSISANAVNSNDNQLAADQGAQARGQLLLDTLTMLQRATRGQPVSYYDAWLDRTVTLDQALLDGAASYAVRGPEGFVDPAPELDPVTAADLVGRFDLSTIGMMGHSRGGEGVTSAATLNQALPTPWAIESILPLAPVDFGRMTVPDVPMNVMLPYCDGDVSNQQGQHMLDDTRYAFDDDVLRTGVWVMGANHNFFNTVWTPGEYNFSVSDDWSGTNPTSARATEPICGTAPSTAETSIRLSPEAQYDLGTAYMAGWFRLTLGGEDQFLSMFDGNPGVPAVLDGADVRTVSTAPASERATIQTFEEADSLVRTFGGATATPCASLSGRTTPQNMPACATTLGGSQVPHWTPASNGGNAPATPMTRMAWTSGTGQLRVAVPRSARDASGFDRLSVKLAADETVDLGTDLTISVVDGAGVTYSALVSELNPFALVRFPTSLSSAATTTLKKVILQQVDVPMSALSDAGLATNDIREVRFTAATGQDALPTGAAYLSDLAFESSAIGTAVAETEPVVDVYAPNRAEGNSADVMEIAAYLAKPADVPVTGFVSLLGGTTSRAGNTMEKVTFAPGETCVVVPAAVQGDTAMSSNAGSTVKASIISTTGAVMGAKSIVFTTISEDDGITNPSVTPLPAYGEPGAVCEELAGVLAGGTVRTQPVDAPGADATVTAAGFRAGEAVVFTSEVAEPVTAIADAAGLATALIPVATDAPRGPSTVAAVGAGTGRTSTGELTVLDVSTTTLTLDPAAPELREPVTLTATVAAGDGDPAGTVEFFDGTESLGSAPTVGGVATLVVPGFGAGPHSLTASYGATGVTQGSVSGPVAFTLSKRLATAMLSLSSAATTFGEPVTASVAIGGGVTDGEVEVSYGGTTVTAAVDDSGAASVDLPADLPAGSYTVSALYTGTEDNEPSTTVTADLVVAPKATTTTIGGAQRTKRGGAYFATVTIGGATADTPVPGTVRVQVIKAGRTVNRTLAVPPSGTLLVGVTAPTKGKAFRLRAFYTGSQSYSASSSAVKVVQLRK